MRIVLAVGLVAAASAQYPIPSRYDGYSQGEPGAPIFLEGFLDLMCPDSKASWPTVQKVMSYYGPSKLRFDFHVFPLPYHWASYLANEGTHVLAANNVSAVWPWIDAVFANQDSFGNDAIANNSFNKVIADFGALAQSAVGVPQDTFAAGLKDRSNDLATRVSWKYACSRAVAGTPTYFINGVPTQASASWTLEDWRKLIDPLLNQSAAAVPGSR